MKATYPEVQTNRDAVIDTIYQLQVDLTIMAEWLAKEPEPAMHEAIH